MPRIRIDLPGDGQWAEFMDPETLTRKQIRQVRIAGGAGENLTQALEFTVEKVLEICLVNWTVDKPLPGDEKDPLTILDSLDLGTWYALEKAAKDYTNNLLDPADKPKTDEKAEDPPKPSDE